MAWTGWPLTLNTSDVQLFTVIDQLWRAAWERSWCFSGGDRVGTEPYDTVGGWRWLRDNVAWAEGVITSAVDNEDGTWTFTDDNLAPAPGTSDDGHYWNGAARSCSGCSYQYWVGLDCTAPCAPSSEGLPYLPANYDVIIEYHDATNPEFYRDIQPWHVMRGDLIATTSQTFTVRIRPENHAVAGLLPDLDTDASISAIATALIGKRYAFIKTGGLWWGGMDPAYTRYPDPPLDDEEWRGTCDEAKCYENGEGYLIEETNKFTESGRVARQVWRPSLTTGTGTDPGTEGEGLGQWVGKEILVFDNQTPPQLHRVTVTGNTDNTLFFGGMTDFYETDEPEIEWEATDRDYLIVAGADSGGVKKGWPGRTGGLAPFQPGWFNAGTPRSVLTHDPSDGLIARDAVHVAANKTVYELDTLVNLFGPAFTCEEDGLTHKVTLDVDLWTAIVNMCVNLTPADHCYSPHIYKTLHHLQVTVLGMITNFVRARDESGAQVDYSGALEIPDYSIAQCFFDAGINAGTSTLQLDTAGYYFQVAEAYYGVGVVWEVKVGGLVVATGNNYTTADETGRVEIGNDPGTDSPTPDWTGAAVVYSATFTRQHPKEFSYMYERGCFIPDIKIEGETETLLYPPGIDDYCGEGGEGSACDRNCEGAGTWIWAQGNGFVSAGYKTYNAYGETQEGQGDFTNGDYAQYTGDNFHEPGTSVTYAEGAEASIDLEFWDRFFEGTHAPTANAKIKQDREGYATGGSKTSLTDTTKRWWDAKWYEADPGNSVAKLHTGEATGGSTTTLVTDEKYTDPDDEESCWFKASRFIGSIFEGKPFVSFILEIDKEVLDGTGTEPVLETYKVVITDVTDLDEGDAPVLHFDSILMSNGDPLTVEAGDVWRIKEPATNLHRYRGKRVRIYNPGGDTEPGEWFEVEITHNDNDTLFFEEQDFPIEAGWKYRIVEHDTGGVWKFSTTEPSSEHKEAGLAWQKVVYYVGTEEHTGYWIQPTPGDADPRGGEDNAWRKDMRENLPWLAPKQYGVILKGDYLFETTFTEIYKILNKLVWTQTTPTWTANGENNARYVTNDIGDMSGDNCESEMTFLEDGWAGTFYEPFNDNQPPSVQSQLALNSPGNTVVIGLFRRYSYLQVTGLPSLIAHKVLAYGKAEWYKGVVDPSSYGIEWDDPAPFGGNAHWHRH